MLNFQLIPKVYAACESFSKCLEGITVPGTEQKLPPDAGLVTTISAIIIPVTLGIGGMLTVIFIIISGIQFITSGGDPKGAAAAKDRLVYAIIGFIVLALAFAALQIIDRIFLGTVIT